LYKKVIKRIDKKIVEIYETIFRHSKNVLPMDILLSLSAVSSCEIPTNESLKAKFMVLVHREYRKFKEIEQVRSMKLEALD
jgi:hypothetical protein